MEQFICKHCGKVCKNKNSLAQHEIRCKENLNRIKIKSNFIEYNKLVKNGMRKGSNQFIKAKENNYEIPTVSDETKIKISKSKKGKFHTQESKLKISKGMQIAVRKYPDSYSSSNVNGRVKKVEYDGIVLDSQWEVDFAKYCDNNNIVWERPNRGFEYLYKNKTHIYYPDFYLQDYNVYVEVKGYKRDKDEYKWKVINNLIIILQDDIKLIRNNEFDLNDKISRSGS